MSIKQVKAVVTPNVEKGIPNALSVTFNLDVPDSVQEYIDRLGETVVKSIIDQQYTIKAQAAARIKLIAKKSAEEIQAWADTYKPSEGKEKMTKAEKAAKLTNDMTPEELQELLKKLKAKLQK